MTTLFARGERAKAICDVCGDRIKYTALQMQVVNGVPTGIKTCRRCNDPDHPQLQLGRVPVVDAQALYMPRPDQYRASYYGFNPLYSQRAAVTINYHWIL